MTPTTRDLAPAEFPLAEALDPVPRTEGQSEDQADLWRIRRTGTLAATARCTRHPDERVRQRKNACSPAENPICILLIYTIM